MIWDVHGSLARQSVCPKYSCAVVPLWEPLVRVPFTTARKSFAQAKQRVLADQPKALSAKARLTEIMN